MSVVAVSHDLTKTHWAVIFFIPGGAAIIIIVRTPVTANIALKCGTLDGLKIFYLKRSGAIRVVDQPILYQAPHYNRCIPISQRWKSAVENKTKRYSVIKQR